MFNLCIMIVHTLKMSIPKICAHLIIFYYIFGSVELRHYFIYTTFRLLALCNLCVICNFNSFHSFLFKQNDCSHIENMQRQRRSSAEFGLVFLDIYPVGFCIHVVSYIEKHTEELMLYLIY